MLPRPPGQGYDTSWLRKGSWPAWKLWGVLLLLACTQCWTLYLQLPSQRLGPLQPVRPQRAASLLPPAILSTSRVSLPTYEVFLETALPRYHIDPSPVPASFRQKVCKYLHEYTVLHRPNLLAMWQRATPYLPLIKRLLRQYGVPTYYAYVPFAESAFQIAAAHPRSGAAGLWQLMPETARAYGLQVSDTVDERFNPLRATEAAVRYLRELQNIFGGASPLHVLAAYNFGESKLSRAIMRARTRDIWYLYRKRYLPSQTREYLAKMVTMWVIVAHASVFQLPPEAPEALITYAEITFAHPVPLALVARQLDVPETSLRQLNPHLLTPRVPAHVPIRVPVTSVQANPHLEVRFTSATLPDTCCAQLVMVDTCWHTVVAGDTLSAIARRYAMDVATLKMLNQLEGANPIIYPGQRLAVCATPTAKAMPPAEFW